MIVTRPVPILAESVSILAGTSPLGWWRFLGDVFLGNLPACASYAVTGATAAHLDDTVLLFGFVMAIAGLVWFVGRRRGATAPRSTEGS